MPGKHHPTMGGKHDPTIDTSHPCGKTALTDGYTEALTVPFFGVSMRAEVMKVGFLVRVREVPSSNLGAPTENLLEFILPGGFCC